MADVFISYKRNDRAVAQALAKRLEEAGYSCWWDSSLVAGEHFNAAIQRQLDEARCVLVLWTRESHESQWVQAEAISGFNRQALISARLDDVELRYPFPIVQTADLRAFTGQGDHPGLFDVVRGIAAKVGRAPRATESAPNAFHETHGELGRARTDATPEPTRRSYALALPIAAVVFVAAIAFAATLFMASREAPSSRDYAAQPDSVVVAATEEDVSAKAPALPPAAEPEQNVGREQDGAANRQVPTHVASTAVPQPQAPQQFDARGSNDCGDAAWCPQMVQLAGGSFMMGAAGRQRATQVAPFAIGAHEVTFTQWNECVLRGGCASNPNPRDAGWGRGSRPVIAVSWRDAQEYVQWLSRETGRAYRLPTEAEWEYAARGDTTTRWSWGDDANQGCAYANFRDMAMNPRAGVTCSDGVGEMTAPVASYQPNPFGLYDMNGNVFEWVQDCRNSGVNASEGGDCGSRVIRGGAWNYSPESSSSSYTRGENQNTRSGSIGFRVAADVR